MRNSASLIVKKTQTPVTSEINSEKEYKIVKLLDTEKEKLSENQKNKMIICFNLKRQKSSLYKKYLEEL